MSREVTELRRQGRFKEAYELAMRERQEEPGEWADTNLFWVLRDMVKGMLQTNTAQSRASAEVCLRNMEKLSHTIVDDEGIGARCLLELQKMLIPSFDELKTLSELSKSNPREAYDKAVTLCGTQGQLIDARLHEDFGWIVYRYMRERLKELSSLEVRSLLRDYIRLNNPRPSMLHSMILSFASNFAREHPDFVFPNFIKLWGLDNFRSEDKRDGYNDGNDIPSLLSRVCATLTPFPDRLINELSSATGIRESEVADMQSKAIFWHLHDKKKNNELKEFWVIAHDYFSEYMGYPGTHWHTEILGLVTRSVDDNYRSAFLTIAEIITPWTIKDEDFTSQKGSDGNEYPAPVIQFVRKCYTFLKADASIRHGNSLLMFLDESYRIIEDKGKADENVRREHAKSLIWANKQEIALPIYRALLKQQGEKYYIWQEAGDCIADIKLRVGFFLRALELEKTEDIIGPLRLKTAQTLAEIGAVENARKLLEAYAANRTRQGKSVPDKWRDIERIISACSESAIPFDTSASVSDAMEYAYADYEPREFVISDKFKVDGKPMISFADKENSFVVPQKRFPNLSSLPIGSVVSVRGYERTDYATTTSYPIRRTEIKTFMPLTIKPIETPKWGILPEVFGYITFENAEKKAYTVVTANSVETFFHDHSERFHKGNFVRFRQYMRQRDGKNVIMVAEPQTCNREDALPQFKSRIVAVDGVNPDKSLFHIVLGKNLISDIVRYNETSLRPKIGDLLNLTYCIRKDKQDKKRIVVLQLSAVEQGTESSLIQTEQGELRTNRNNRGKTFGFVGDTYIPAKLLDISGADECDKVCVRSVMTPEGKWKAFSLDIIEKDGTYDLDKEENW